jgi:hypothetical protein
MVAPPLTSMALVAFAGGAALAVPQEPEPARARAREPLLEGVWRSLALGSEGDAEARERAVAALVALGPPVVPALVDVLAGFEPPPRPRTEGARSQAGLLDDAAAWQPLAIAALRWLPEDELLGAVRAKTMGKGVPREQRIAGIRILGGGGTAPAAMLMLESTAEMAEIELARMLVQRPIVDALAAILDRDGSAYGALEERIAELPPRLLPLIAQALAEAGAPRGLELLLGLLQRDRDLDLVLVRSIAELAGKGEVWLEEPRYAYLRRFLDDIEPQMRQAAALALGRVQDLASFEPMIARLEDPDPRVQRAALWSLQAMSGLKLPANPRHWSAWHAAEIDWLERDLARLERRLRSRSSAEVVEAIAELARHRLFRHETAPLVFDSLECADPGIASSACAALEQLRSARAVPALTGALTHKHPAVRAAAASALRALTGKDVARVAAAEGH